MDKKTDLRVRRTQKNMRIALLELLKEKLLDQIQVKELAARAEISRATFYLYYDNVHSMMRDIEAEIFSDYVDILRDILDQNLKFEDFFRELMRRPFTENPELFPFVQYIYSNYGTHISLRRGAALIKSEILKHYTVNIPEQEFNYFFDFLLNGSIAAIARWTQEDGGKKHSLDDLAELLLDFSYHGKAYLELIS